VAQRRPVKLGGLEDNHYELLDGLEAGTPVIVGSLQQLRDGQPIQPKPVQRLPGEGEGPGVGGAADAGTGGAGDAGMGSSPDGGK
jgi:hypothetical protein